MPLSCATSSLPAPTAFKNVNEKGRTLFHLQWKGIRPFFLRRKNPGYAKERRRKLCGALFCRLRRRLDSAGRGDWIRTSGLYVPNVALYQAEPHLEMAAEEGFEPSQTESESAVLPLHNSAIFFRSFCLSLFAPDNDIYYIKNFPFVNTFFQIF